MILLQSVKDSNFKVLQIELVKLNIDLIKTSTPFKTYMFVRTHAKKNRGVAFSSGCYLCMDIPAM